DVYAKVMAAVLHEPWFAQRRSAENGEGEIIVAEGWPSFTLAFALAFAAPANFGILIGVHDVDDFLITSFADNPCQNGQGCMALYLRQIAETNAVTRHDIHGQVGPAGLLGTFEIEYGLGPSLVIEGSEERFGRIHRFGRLSGWLVIGRVLARELGRRV